MRNLFEECGYSRFDIENKVIECWNEIFNQQNPNHFYFDCGNGTGYMEDTGNDDARTEGMSYGMMMALQMNRKDIFDRIWKWARDNMYLSEIFVYVCLPYQSKTVWHFAMDLRGKDLSSPSGRVTFTLSPSSPSRVARRVLLPSTAV